ncbi:hypothetical protein [Microcoleus sp. herbarium14]|uniref:hypothetical protein n=1 Tax=Microcoleus sp. herbarium14 TaxID=3055439 RepID=UPI002FD20705
MTDLYFWAQSLDNQAPDIIFKNQEVLSDDESRQKLVSEIYEFPKSDSEVVSAHSAVTIRYSYSKFVIEAIPIEKDTVKRLAPIVIYGELPNKFPENWVESVHSDIQNFVSTKLERNLDESALIDIKKGLSEILNNKNGRFAIQSFQSNPQVSLLLLVNRLELLVKRLKLLVKKIIRY